jgi:hypothetical protein
MPYVGFEPTITEFERAKTARLPWSATMYKCLVEMTEQQQSKVQRDTEIYAVAPEI